MAETLLLLHGLMLTAAEFYPLLLLFPSVPHRDTPAPLYWQWFPSLLLEELLQQLLPRSSLLLTLPWPVPHPTKTLLLILFLMHNFPNGTLSTALRDKEGNAWIQ